MMGIWMATNFQQIIESLNKLTGEDFDLNRVEADGAQKLYALTDELLQQPNRQQAIPVLFAVMERIPNADLGSPGPLVHTLEEIKNYERELVASLRRAPCPLSVWMVNRMLNGTKNTDQREAWLKLLDAVTRNPSATAETKRSALGFIKFQKENFK